jgi:predicted DNA-binding transcriptional regulator AlpA
MPVQLITKDDLEEFKSQLFTELKQILPGSPGSQKKWLKSYEVRAMLGISRGTLQHMNNRTLFPSLIGGLMFYDYDEILKLMESTKSKPKTCKTTTARSF